jgi:predicted metal-dependent phosphoesterase TrpH
MRVDLHVHTNYSHDGGIRINEIHDALTRPKNALGLIAITDHDRIDGALEIQKSLGELGARIIVGSEIKTAKEGEIIGLYLHEEVPAGMSAKDTITAIKQQGGLVYIPHPFETRRSGIPEETLKGLMDHVDIIETLNGRAYYGNKSPQATAVAAAYEKPCANSSDAHGRVGWGKTFSDIPTTTIPSKEQLAELLRTADLSGKKVGPIGVCYPKWNKITKKLGLQKTL